MAGPIGTLGTIPTLTVGGYVFATFTNFKQIMASHYGNKYSTFKSLPATNYQVPSGKLFKCKSIIAVSTGDSVTNPGLCYGSSAVGYNSASGPTSQVDIYSSGVGVAQVHISTGVNIKMEIPFVFDFPQLVYPTINATNSGGTSGCTMYLYGYEEA